MSSTRAWRAGERGRDLDRSGVMSSVVRVWRISCCSPGAVVEVSPGWDILVALVVVKGRSCWSVGLMRRRVVGCLNTFRGERSMRELD